MSRYTARIELHAPDGEAQADLHKEMMAEGFERTKQPDPNGLGAVEYGRESDLALGIVFDSARRAAARTGVPFSVMVCEPSTKKWIGLNVSRMP